MTLYCGFFILDATFLAKRHLLIKIYMLMKKYMSILVSLSLCLTLFSTQCDVNDIPGSQEDEQQELAILKAEIENLASTSVCGNTFECNYIALGSKPCGGPRSYLVYSTSIDTNKLETLVEKYNKKETAFNTKWGISSDCALTSPPSSLKCENNTCVAVY